MDFYKVKKFVGNFVTGFAADPLDNIRERRRHPGKPQPANKTDSDVGPGNQEGFLCFAIVQNPVYLVSYPTVH